MYFIYDVFIPVRDNRYVCMLAEFKLTFIRIKERFRAVLELFP